jgi:invasion protein IalB
MLIVLNKMKLTALALLWIMFLSARAVFGSQTQRPLRDEGPEPLPEKVAGWSAVSIRV